MAPMKPQDTRQRFLFKDKPLRGEVVRLNQAVLTVLSQQAYPSLVKTLLAEALVAAPLMRSSLKRRGSLSLHFESRQALQLMLVKCDDECRLRGVVRWDEPMDEVAFFDSLHNGILVVTLDPEVGRRYQGMVKWQGDSLATSLEYYFVESEQLPTQLHIVTTDKEAFGLLLQQMPSKEPMDPEQWQSLCTQMKSVDAELFQTMNSEDLLAKVFPQDEIDFFEANEIRFHCPCSPERMANAIRVIGEQEAEEVLQLKQVIEVNCEFCGNKFSFNREQVKAIFDSDDSSDHQTRVVD
jgi:molecular chaperone Hsp33